MNSDKGRQITKIARHVARYAALLLKKEDIGSSEIDVVHAIRKNPGATASRISESLSLDKAGIARIVKRLERKGYVEPRPSQQDRRSVLLYATDKAQDLKVSRTALEQGYYDWLLGDLEEDERQAFLATLSRIYLKSKAQNKLDFKDIDHEE
ncbi:MAG: MarR family transcriptional regulator [Sphaerochaetaceae bacterium]|nr:MarR family transcriptional regulator [Sphaerochaetaceae bacterium]